MLKKNACIFLAMISLLLSAPLFAQNQITEPLLNRYSFGEVQGSSLYNALSLLDNDSMNRSLATACILGTSVEELKENNIPNLSERLDKLVASGILKISEGKYYLSFPVILGKKRELLYDLVWKKAMTLLPVAEPILGKLRKELGSRQDMAFHIFWTRIMNDEFIALWHKEFPDEKQNPSEIWLVYPRHPFMVGCKLIETDKKAQLAISWNNHNIKNIQPIASYKNILYANALNNAISKDSIEAMKKYGFNEVGNNRPFVYNEGDKLDKECQELTQELLPAFASLYDYKSLGKTFEISEKEMFLIVLHETAYSLFENMQQLNKLELPVALRNDSSSMAMVQLVSLKIGGNK
jgi:hypothetical protein